MHLWCGFLATDAAGEGTCLKSSSAFLRSSHPKPPATSHLRPNDLFGRIGGEEFASLLLNTGRHDALWLAERVRKAFEASFHTTGQDAFGSTVSVGVAISDERSDLNGPAQRGRSSALSSEGVRPESRRAVATLARAVDHR
jgi:hypothetical protein